MSALEALVLVAMLAGLVGVVVPVLPGLVLIAGAGVVWAALRGVGATGWLVVAVMALLAVGGTVFPYLLSGRRSAAAGIPRWVLWSGAAGGVIGFFVIPVVGALAGVPSGIFVAELVRLRSPGAAWRSCLEALKGLGIGTAVEFGVGVAMIGVWLAGVLIT